MAIMPQTPAANPNVSDDSHERFPGGDDRRCDGRIERELPARLVEWGGGEPIDCVIRNVASGGAFVTPCGEVDLSVGQRYEVFLEKGCPRDLAEAFADGCFATVIRTQVISDERVVLGAGVRFDQPLML